MAHCSYNEKDDTYKDADGNIYTFKQYARSRTPRKPGRPKVSEPSQESDFKTKIYQTTTKDNKKKKLKISKNWLDHCRQQDIKL
jgi:hypothetical protein